MEKKDQIKLVMFGILIICHRCDLFANLLEFMLYLHLECTYAYFQIFDDHLN
jgi:hypothetical protein